MQIVFFFYEVLTQAQIDAVAKAASSEGATRLGDFASDGTVAYMFGNTGWDNIEAAFRVGRASNTAGEIAYSYGGGQGYRMFRPF